MNLYKIIIVKLNIYVSLQNVVLTYFKGEKKWKRGKKKNHKSTGVGFKKKENK